MASENVAPTEAFGIQVVAASEKHVALVYASSNNVNLFANAVLTSQCVASTRAEPPRYLAGTCEGASNPIPVRE